MKRNISLLFGLEFLRDALYAGLFILLPFIAKDLHLSLTESGFVQSFIYLVGLIFSFPLHFIIGKFSSMKLLNISLATFALACFGLFMTFNYYSLLGAFFFAGLGFSIYASLAHGLLVKFADKEHRGKLVGNMMAVGDIGKVITSSTFASLVFFIGWKSLGLFLGIFFVIVFIVYEIMHTPEIKIKEKDISSQKVTLRYLFSHKEFLYVLAIGGLDMFANVPLYFLLPFLLLFKGLPTQMVGLITGTYFLGNTISRLIFGRLVDKHGSIRMFIFAEIIMAIMLVLLVQSHSLMTISICAILLGLITEASDPATVTMTSKIADKIGSFEKVFNARAFVNRLMTLIGPFLLGFIGEKLGLQWSFYTIALAVLLATIPAFLLLKKNPKM
jgi:MFS family permease